MIRLPNLLARPNGRLAALFFLYVTEGIPLGFAATAVASQLRRMGVGPAEIGAFVASFYLPWAFKWAFGPMVDVFRSRRFGHRRAWIAGTQLMMATTLMLLVFVPLPQALGLFTVILLVHNSFGAMQDVAIDALAVNSLGDGERGLANGLMFAGAAMGQAVGGAGVLFLLPYTGFHGSFFLVAAAILTVTTLVVLPMREAVAAQVATVGESAVAGWQAARAELRSFAAQSFQSFLGSRAAFVGVFVALLPAGAMPLSLALQTNLAVELGMDNQAVARLSLASTISSAVSMVVGGVLADRLGRRRMLMFYIALMSLPVRYTALQLQQAGYVMPRPPGGTPMPGLITQLWIAVLAFNVALGLMYGTRSAVFMDVTNPRVAGTQFTAYMEMLNLAIAFAATWLGIAVEALGYPMTMLLDAGVGLLCLLLLPLMDRAKDVAPGLCDARSAARAGRMARVLGLLCFAFVPYLWWGDPTSRLVGIANTVFTLVFVASALFVYAATLLQDLTPGRQRACRWLALGLLALYLRKFVPAQQEEFAAAVQLLCMLVAAAAALQLLLLGRRDWTGLQPQA